MTPAVLSPTQAGPAIDALAHAIDHGALTLPPDGRMLFLRARAAAALRLLPRQHWLCEQSFKPDADALLHAGLHVGEASADARYPLVLVLPPRQRDEARALYARALTHAEPGGVIAAALANDEGGKSGAADLARLAGAVEQLSKHKCRVYWTRRDDAGLDAALVSEWTALDRPRLHAQGYFSRPGLFAWDRIDAGSALLVEQLPDTLRGRVADLGAGYGYLACELLRRCPAVAAIDLYEAEARALEPARLNLAPFADTLPIGIHWHDVTRGVPARYDVIVSNPPFHLGRADLPTLGRSFITAAAAALEPDGELYLVANRHLPYEATMRECFQEMHVLADRHGYKVIHARRPRA